MHTLSVGILGLCHLHPRSYMPILQAVEGMKVVAAADANEAVLEAFARDFHLHPFTDWQVMIEAERLDLAVLFLPHAQCPEAAIACAQHGINLLIEKPMAASSEGLRRTIAAAHKAGVVLSTPYVWRYHPVARQMKKFVEDGVLGRVVGCEGRCAAGRLHRYIDGHARWMLSRALSGGGPMYNLGVHWIDLYRWLLNDEVVEVFGKNVKINQEYDIEDNSFALLTFSKGAVVALDISYTVPDSYPFGRDLFLALRGTGGALILESLLRGPQRNPVRLQRRWRVRLRPASSHGFRVAAASRIHRHSGRPFPQGPGPLHSHQDRPRHHRRRRPARPGGRRSHLSIRPARPGGAPARPHRGAVKNLKIVVTDYIEPDLNWEAAELAKRGLHFLYHQLKFAPLEQVIAATWDADIVIVNMLPVTPDLIAGWEKCRLVIRHGVGYDNVDLAALDKAGIPLCYIPDYCVEEVAEQAIALMLACGRKLISSRKVLEDSSARGRWDFTDVIPIFRIAGRTVGIIGCGRIGSRVYQKLQSFGFKFLICDPYLTEERKRELGIEVVDKETVFRGSDFVTIHTPLTHETRHIVTPKPWP